MHYLGNSAAGNTGNTVVWHLVGTLVGPLFMFMTIVVSVVHWQVVLFLLFITASEHSPKSTSQIFNTPLKTISKL